MTEDSLHPATEIEATWASSQSETESGYGTTPVICHTTEQAKKALIFSRKSVPQQFLNRLTDIRALFTESLLDRVSAKQRPTSAASMELKYAEHDDTLYLVIQCDKRDKKRMREFFDQSHVKEIIGDDIGIHIATGLREFATQELKVYGLMSQILSPGVMISIEGTRGSSRATLGGIITVVKDGLSVLYGLTAGHALTRLVRNSNRPSPSRGTDIGADSDTSYESDESFDFSADGQSNPFTGVHNDGESRTPLASLSQIGSITAHSFQSTSSSTNYDWALIKLDTDVLFSNRIPISCPSGSHEQPNPTIMLLKSLVSTPLQSPVSVIIRTSRGNQRGMLTSSTSSLLIAPGREFVETHDVVLDDGFSLKPGDLGSWVICETTGEVYGHVVSMDMFGEAYVLPLDHILRDIQVHLQADHVGLPQDFDNSTIQTQQDPRPFESIDVSESLTLIDHDSRYP
ncbi:hypothetical protein F5Y12DRAFT_798299 [Xylaria sp. FL1777]|nr:hypothetical protein F5Y12DRAFT_798299 [Xylaria sp. FL1777]